MPEMMGKARPAASVSARVFDKNGKLIADLGEVAGGNLTKKEKKALQAKLKQLKKGKVR